MPERLGLVSLRQERRGRPNPHGMARVQWVHSRVGDGTPVASLHRKIAAHEPRQQRLVS